jgi:hypothetical protein
MPNIRAMSGYHVHGAFAKFGLVDFESVATLNTASNKEERRGFVQHLAFKNNARFVILENRIDRIVFCRC